MLRLYFTQKMKLVLIQPPIEDFYFTSTRAIPLGLHYLKSYIEKFLPNWEVILLDFQSNRRKKELPFPDKFNYLKEYYFEDESPFCAFSKYCRFGSSDEEIKKIISDYSSADVFGISILFSAYSYNAFKIAAIIKSISLSPIIVGGHHVTCLKEKILEDSNIDFIVLGEGERPLKELLVAIENKRDISKIKGIGYRKNGKIFINEHSSILNIDEIPYPDIFTSSNFIPILTSRGCPYNCEFCVIKKTFSNYRRRNNQSILSEIKMYFERGINKFNFEDDNLTFDKDASFELFIEIGKKFKNLSFYAMNGLSFFDLDPKLLTIMKSIGFRKLDISLVSVSIDSNRLLRRPYSLNKLEEIIKTCEFLNLPFTLYVILGIPSERIHDMLKSICYCSRTIGKIGPSIYYYLPNGDDIDPIFFRSSSIFVKSEKFKRNELFTLFIICRIINFLKNIPLEKEIDFCTLVNDFSLLRLNKRQLLGMNILKKMLSEKYLFSYSNGSFRPIINFDYKIFEKFILNVGYIKTFKNIDIIF